MTSGYYAAGAERARRVQELFGKIAGRYDLINDLQSFGLHRLWKRSLVRLCGVQRTDRALDVCCGTGDIAFSLAEAGATVSGCDFSNPMLAVAQKRNAGTCRFIQGDALALPFPDATFDLVTIGYGLRNLADLERGIVELLRILKPSGRLLVLDFGKPRNPIWRALYFTYLRAVVPCFGLIFCGDAAAYGYILESLQHYPAQDGVEALLRKHHCGNVQVRNFLGGVMSIHRATKRG